MLFEKKQIAIEFSRTSGRLSHVVVGFEVRPVDQLLHQACRRWGKQKTKNAEETIRGTRLPSQLVYGISGNRYTKTDRRARVFCTGRDETCGGEYVRVTRYKGWLAGWLGVKIMEA